MASAVGDVAGSGCSEGESARTGAGTGARTSSDADGPEGAKGKVDITIPNKTNKTPILVSY